MKKIIALLLALVMVMGLATAVSAATTTYSPSEPTSFNITKQYASDETFVPGETLSFTITADSNNPDATKLISIGTENKYTVPAGTAVEEGKAKLNVAVTVPSYSEVGTYKYTIKEVLGNTAGVAYDTATTIEVAVLVVYDNTNDKLVIENTNYIMYQGEGENKKKVDTFENAFDTYEFSVKKQVTGNMANKTDKFTINVALTSEKEILTAIKIGDATVNADAWAKAENTWTYNKQLSLSDDDAAVTFADIPDDVTVLVTETDGQLGYTTKSIDNQGVVNANSEDKAITVLNEKKSEIETGIVMDSVPFIVMAVIAVLGVVAITAKKRVQE